LDGRLAHGLHGFVWSNHTQLEISGVETAKAKWLLHLMPDNQAFPSLDLISTAQNESTHDFHQCLDQPLCQFDANRREHLNG
jgi:hypothetical protein